MLNGVRVLIVERDPAYGKVLSILVREAGAVIRVVETAEAAVAAIGEFQPQLVTVDLVLARMSGLALIEELRHNPLTQHVPVVAVTGYDVPGLAERVRAAGALELIRKPVPTDTFAEQLGAILKRGKA